MSATAETHTAAAPNEENYQEILDFLRPSPGELRWQEIPWQTDLRVARRLAETEQKPIFLWTMNGNPLGCT